MTAPAGNAHSVAPPVLLSFQIIKKRRDFIAASRARRWAAPGLVLQGRKRREGETPAPDAIRVGYTCSKKVGNAVARNRAKRRLREAAAHTVTRFGQKGWDYVLIGRHSITAERLFTDLVSDVETALARVHAPRRKT